jgi:UDP-2-acetamido-3-amino-2,3-dideoxy-glucuronate N-acetyltransferase
MKFSSGIGAHIFVSWLHPFKEQKMVIIGDRKMVVFDDTAPIDKKLMLYPHKISWKDGAPVPEKKKGSQIKLSKTWEEPLTSEGRAFIDAINGRPALTDGQEGLRVLKVLQLAQASMDNYSHPSQKKSYFIHESSFMDEGCEIGAGTKIWHFSHILKNTQIGNKVNIGQNVVIGPDVKVGNNVKIQNNVSVYPGVTLEDNVFCGPSCVFTNVINPRSSIPRKSEILQTLVQKGATIGANSTILCGITIGKYAFIGAGSIVTQDVEDNALVYGNPAKFQGWICDCGCKLDVNSQCSECGKIIKTQ